MEFHQFYLGCLAHASYIIGSNGEAAVIDPQRDVGQYVDFAEERRLKIRYIVETHLHADFVSGHRELQEKTGAEIVFGHRAGATLPHRAVTDGDQLRVGEVLLRVIETPGHTPESISLLATDPSDPAAPVRVFTGDTLFIGDVGRPDLVGSKGHSAEAMAGMLYESLHEKLLRLPDEVEVYPAHGAGSLCGRHMSRETMSTIGEQRRFNYALKPMSKDEFIRMMTTDLPEAPAYFAKDAELNRTGAAPLDRLPEGRPLTPGEARDFQGEGHMILDVRPSSAFGNAHVPGSVNIGLGGQFASWAGSLIPMGTRVVIVAEDEVGVGEATLRLARVGLDSVDGYLAGGIYAWDRAGFELARIPQMPVDELEARIEEGVRLRILDVRRPSEYQSGHVPGAGNLPLADLERQAAALPGPRDAATVVICLSGYRSSAATSLLARMGFSDLYNVVGGTTAWVSAKYPVETPAG